MIMIEMRQAAKDKAFDLLDEIKDLGHKKKMALCELEDTLYDCFESSEDEDEVDNEMPEEDEDMDFRRTKSYRYRRSGMRHMYDDDDMSEYRRRGMRGYRRNYRMRVRRG